MSRLIYTLLYTLTGLLIISCGDSSQDDFAPPPPPTQSAAGIWAGPFTSETDASVAQTIGLVTDNNDVQLVAGAISEKHYAGLVSTDVDNLLGTLTVYRGRAGPFIGTSGVQATQSIMLEGTASEKSNLSGTYSGDEDSGRFNLAYLGIYETPSSLDLTSGTWLWTEASAGGALYTVTFDIDAAGSLFGTDSAGCVYSGQVAVIEPQFNGYSVTIDVSSCLLNNGNYSGLAWLSGTGGGQQNLLTMGLNKATRAFAIGFQKL